MLGRGRGQPPIRGCAGDFQQVPQCQVWGLAVFPTLCSFHASLEAAAFATEPGAPIPAAPAGDRAGTTQVMSLHLLPHGCGLDVIQDSGMAGRNLMCGCRQPSDRHGVVYSVLAREEGCCLGQARRAWRGSGTPALPSLLGPSWFSSSVLGFDRVSLSLHISPSLLRIPGCVYRSARAASKREPPWAAARRGVPTPTTTRVPSTQVSLATGMGHGVLGTLTQLNVGPVAPELELGSCLAGLPGWWCPLCQQHWQVSQACLASHKHCGWWVAMDEGDTEFHSKCRVSPDTSLSSPRRLLTN